MDQNALDRAIRNQLIGAPALVALLFSASSVYHFFAPQGTEFPYVVFNTQTPSTPVRTLSRVAYENIVYQVQGVTKDPSAAGCGDIATQIDAAMSAAPLTVAGFQHMRCTRESDVDYVEVVDGVRYNHRGALYRVQVTS